MWTEIISLLKIQFKDESEEEQFDADLPVLNEWVKREYKTLTCEELTLAYNALVKEELTKPDGRLIEAYRCLDPKHIGEVIAAYRRQVDNDTEINRVMSQHLYLPAPAALTESEIDAQMEKNLKDAINLVKAGVNYFDLGNGLYAWLYKKGRIRPTNDEWEEAIILAKARVRGSLAIQKETAAKLAGFESLRAVIGKRLGTVMNEEGDYKLRVRQEAFRICLTNWLKRKTGVTAELVSNLPTTPSLKPPESDAQKPFSHNDYIKSLTEQLPTMGDEAVSELQRYSRRRNILDVYELATAEWNARQAAKPAKKKK
ncbi:hypothetical protein [Spirosoma sp.]|uniref:hypothetical protein n=1 Tax=Spirosoma sp. TaxID=1899569 RepID=UPI002635205A|nr:hypothetical protein [Spirosoma sp.]MCX6218314.1 hypothetical protein [Spirosoma sp.]